MSSGKLAKIPSAKGLEMSVSGHPPPKPRPRLKRAEHLGGVSHVGPSTIARYFLEFTAETDGVF